MKLSPRFKQLISIYAIIFRNAFAENIRRTSFIARSRKYKTFLHPRVLPPSGYSRQNPFTAQQDVFLRLQGGRLRKYCVPALQAQLSFKRKQTVPMHCYTLTAFLKTALKTTAAASAFYRRN